MKADARPSMRIAIDLQACQTGSRDRGIGRYAMDLVEAIARRGARTEHISLVLDGSHPGRLRDLRNRLRSLCIAADNNVVCHYPISAYGISDAVPEIERAGALLRARAMGALNPDVLLVTSFFEGFDDGASVTSSLDWDALEGVKTAVIAYDLIPLIYPERYLPAGSSYATWYLDKLDQFKRFDLFLAISEATKRDLMEHLKIPEERIAVIGAGLTRKLQMERKGQNATALKNLGITQPFVLVVGNADWRKNNICALEAFASLPREIRKKHQLVLTQVGPDVAGALKGIHRDIAGQVKVLGRVDDELLATLYQQCKVFFFPSLHEGFGLPVLEAMAMGAPVLSSNLGSLPEVMLSTRGLFDPRDPVGAATILAEALTDERLRGELSRGVVDHAQTFTWEVCAARAIDALTVLTEARGSPRSWEPSQADVEILAKAVIKGGDQFGDRRTLLGLHAAARGARRRVLVDVTVISSTEARTGIQRVVRNYCTGLANLAAATGAFDVVPFRWSYDGLRYARHFAREQLGLDYPGEDARVEVMPNDLVFMLDSTWEDPERFDVFLDEVSLAGGEIVWMVYDLVPIRVPHTCHPGMPPVFSHWLNHAIKRTDGFICISEATRADLENFMDEVKVCGTRRPWTRSVHLGCDLESGQQLPTTGASERVLEAMAGKIFVCAIGTVEPRKDYTTILDAFELTWQHGSDVALVIIGKAGWNVGSLVERIQQHPENGKRLFWLQSASDGDLQVLLGCASALVQASIAEGFGLPIVEAGSQGVSLILSDIAVFREIAGDEALYFRVGDAADLASVVRAGLANGGWPHPTKIRALTWKQSASELCKELVGPRQLQDAIA